MGWVRFITLFTSHISLANLHFTLYIDTQIFVCFYDVSFFIFLSLPSLCLSLSTYHSLFLLFLSLSPLLALSQSSHFMLARCTLIRSLIYHPITRCSPYDTFALPPRRIWFHKQKLHGTSLPCEFSAYTMTKIELESIESVNSIILVAAQHSLMYSSTANSLVLDYIFYLIYRVCLCVPLCCCLFRFHMRLCIGYILRKRNKFNVSIHINWIGRNIAMQVRHKRIGSERNRSRSTILFVEKSEVSLTVNVSECMNSLIFQIKPRIVVEFNRIRFCMLCAYDIPPPSKSDIVEEKTELDKLIHTLCSRNAFMPNVDVSD